MHFTTSVESEIYVSGNFGPAIFGILRAQLHVLLERVNYYTVLLDWFEVLGGRLLLFRDKNIQARWHL
jgi:hypothetical protein